MGMRVSPELERQLLERGIVGQPTVMQTGIDLSAAEPKKIATGRRHVQGRMNKLESEYAARLDLRQAVGEIIGYRFEAIKLRLADKTFYTADFFLMLADCSLEVHEVKGYMYDDAAVKLKVAAEQYPWFRFFLVTRTAKKDGGGWKVRDV